MKGESAWVEYRRLLEAMAILVRSCGDTLRDRHVCRIQRSHDSGSSLIAAALH